AEPSRASRLRSRAGRSVFPRNVPDLDVRLLRGPLSLVPPGRPLRARGPRRSSGRFLVLDGFPGRSGRRGVGAHAGRPCRAARKSGGAGPLRPGPARRGASGGRGVRVRVPRHARLADRPVLLSRNAGLTAPTVFVRTRAWTSPASAAPTRT